MQYKRIWLSVTPHSKHISNFTGCVQTGAANQIDLWGSTNAAMLGCVGHVAQPAEICTAGDQSIAEPLIREIVSRVLTRIPLMPDPLMNMPRWPRSLDRGQATRAFKEPGVRRRAHFEPK